MHPERCFCLLKPLAGHRLASAARRAPSRQRAADVLHFDADDDSAGITLPLVTDDWQGRRAARPPG